MVLPSADVVFYDPFTYADGSVLTNSAFLWDNRSGTIGQCQIISGQLEIGKTNTEDVIADLVGGPFARSNNIVLYASFKINAQGLPKNTPEYFAHFVGGNANTAVCMPELPTPTPAASAFSWPMVPTRPRCCPRTSTSIPATWW